MGLWWLCQNLWALLRISLPVNSPYCGVRYGVCRGTLYGVRYFCHPDGIRPRYEGKNQHQSALPLLLHKRASAQSSNICQLYKGKIGVNLRHTPNPLRHELSEALYDGKNPRNLHQACPRSGSQSLVITDE